MNPMKLRGVYLLWVEESREDIFALVGVVLLHGKAKMSLYCQNVYFNRYKAALTKADWEAVQHPQGLQLGDWLYRLQDVTEEMAQKGWTTVADVHHILRHFHTKFPRQLYFLEKELTS